jgi:hypothetical protein
MVGQGDVLGLVSRFERDGLNIPRLIREDATELAGSAVAEDLGQVRGRLFRATPQG